MQRRQALKTLGAVSVGAAILPAARAFMAFGDGPFPAGIHVNQVGYLPSAAKVATVANAPADAPLSFSVIDAAGNKVLSATLTASQMDAASGDTLSQADFSSITAPGTYRVQAVGMTSDSFAIAPDVYRNTLYLAARSYYGQRCGCKVDLGDGYQHPACHTDGQYHPTSGRDGKAKHLGGWHDAGDYGRYVTNSGVSTATLIYAYDLYPDALRNLSLDIPKHHKHLPDILAEVRWNLDWMISMQDHDGGVWHKQTSEHFCRFILPQDDHLPSYVVGSGHAPFKTTAASADLAGTAALAARVYAPFDKQYAAHCLDVARKAWRWAVDHPNEVFRNPAAVDTGEYGDRSLTDEVFWASAELFRVTGEPEFEAQLLAEFSDVAGRLRVPLPGWSNLFAFGCLAYAQTPQGNTGVKELIRIAWRRSAEDYVAQSTRNGYGNTLALREYFWGSNGQCANQSMYLLLGDRLEPNAAFRATALANLHYLLGRNCHGVSWVTHVGARPFQHPHHRPSAADGIAAPWPGLLSGGPNAHPGDETARTLATLPPMRMWLDDERAYSLNEIAINWNAPLVFLLAASRAS